MAFELILAAANAKGLLKEKAVGVDATDLEANASLKSIVRKDNGNHWREYLRNLYEEETGISDPDNDEFFRFDQRRKPKKSERTGGIGRANVLAKRHRIGKQSPSGR